MVRALMLAGVGFFGPSLLLATPLQLHGRVVDPGHQPLEGVRVSVEGSPAAVESGADGTFTLELATSAERVRLHLEHAGYHPLEHVVAPDEVGRELEVVLVPLEVARGPVGFLYGGGSSGGILDIVTRGGEGGPFSGRVWATATATTPPSGRRTCAAGWPGRRRRASV